jgi:hypothetical protein
MFRYFQGENTVLEVDHEFNSRMIPLVQGTSPPGKFDGLGLLQDDVGPVAWVTLLLFAALLFP